MDERAVRAAVDRIQSEAHGLHDGIGGECRLVPVAAIDALVAAVQTPAEPVGTCQPKDWAELGTPVADEPPRRTD